MIFSAIDKDSIYRDLDAAGPWPKTASGSLEPEASVRFRYVIGTQSYRNFIPRKEELMNERFSHINHGREKEYQMTIRKAQEDYGKVNTMVTQIAAEFVGLNQQTFQSSMELAHAIPEIVAQMKKDDEEVRLRAEPPSANPLTKEQAKAIIIEKLQMESENQKKFATFQPKSQEEANQIMAVERTRVMDKIYMKH